MSERPASVLTEPSYAARTITRIAEHLEQRGGRQLTDGKLRRAFTVAAAAELHTLPDPVANQVTEKVARLLPPLRPGITSSEYVPLLNTLARTV